MTEIEKIINRNINLNGTISIEEYMTIALYHSKYGYYSKKNIIGQEKNVKIKKFSQQTIYGELINKDNSLAA